MLRLDPMVDSQHKNLSIYLTKQIREPDLYHIIMKLKVLSINRDLLHWTGVVDRKKRLMLSL